MLLGNVLKISNCVASYHTEAAPPKALSPLGRARDLAEFGGGEGQSVVIG
jgi:hypothetical protein